MEARLVKLSRVTPERLRELGVREVGRVGSILYVDTEGPLVLMHVTSMAQDRALDRFGLDRARTMIDELRYTIDETAGRLGVSASGLVAQLGRDGWVQSSHQLDAPRVGANARMNRPTTGSVRKPKVNLEVSP